jgi:hypothetical protein
MKTTVIVSTAGKEARLLDTPTGTGIGSKP